MPFLDEIAAEVRPKPSKCRIRELIETMPDGDEFEQALQATSATGEWQYTNSALSRVLAKRKLYNDPKIIAQHRRGDCSCHLQTT